MKLLETYALNCGAKIDKPFILESFIPIPFDRYITIHNGSGMESKNYDYWPDVLEYMIPFLNFHKIHVVSLGSQKDAPIMIPGLNIYNARNCSINQTAYIINRSLLHLSNDTCTAHIAGSFGIPLIVPYGPTSIQGFPYHYNKEKTIFIESHRFNKNPSFSKVEKEKTINLIFPDKIAKAALSLLSSIGSEFPITSSILNIGSEYGDFTVEYVPNVVLTPNALQGGLLNVRMDYHFNPDVLIALLQQRKLRIITDKPIDTRILKLFAKNIDFLSYTISEKTTVDELSKITKLGIKTQFVYQGTDADILKKLKIKFFDFNIDNIPETPIIPEEVKNATCKVAFKTRKFILSNQKLYLSFYHYINDIPTPSFADNKSLVIDHSDFWRESPRMLFEALHS